MSPRATALGTIETCRENVKKTWIFRKNYPFIEIWDAYAWVPIASYDSKL
jgi:hypothetical protein